MLSKCCNWKYRTEWKTTKYHVCNECDNACDIIKMKTTKDLIQFWIDNWFNETTECWYTINYTGWTIENVMLDITSIWLIKVITSKPFIESIARGIWNNKELFVNFERDEPLIKNKEDYGFLKEEDYEDIYKQPLITSITFLQGIAIRENSVDWVSLDKFITNILKDELKTI